MSTTENQRWFAFGDHEDFKDEPVIACFIAKVYHFWRGRNAYWGSWSSQYPGNSAFTLQMEAMKKRIEAQRIQGSQFTIVEMPVLALCGEEDALLVGEINCNSPLAGHRLPLDQSMSIAALANTFRPQKANSVVRFVCRSVDVMPARFPFQKYQSSAIGARSPLYWSKTSANVKLEPMLARTNQACRRLHRQ